MLDTHTVNAGLLQPHIPNKHTVAGTRTKPRVASASCRQRVRCFQDVIVAALPAAAQIAGAVALGVPASIVVDAAFDRVQDRVGSNSNGAAQDTKFYIAGGTEAAALRQGQNPRPAVVLIHQIFGLQPREVEMCDELARHGYIAVAPDTFQGCATTWIPRALTLAYPAALAADAHWGTKDIHNVIQWLQQQPGVDPAQIAVVGFCYGGGAALRYSAAHPQAVAAVGVFYGRPLSEAADYAKLQAPVLGVYGGRDQQFPEATVDQFERQLGQAGVAHRIRRFPQEGHAFVTDLASTRQPGSASAETWAAFLQFLAEHLRGKHNAVL